MALKRSGSPGSFWRGVTGRGVKNLWGQSPRSQPEDIPEWARQFQENDWRATPNPRAQASKQQRRARLLLRLILASLPVSLLSCLFSISRSSSPPPVVPVATDSSSGVPQAQTQAQIVAREWLHDGRLNAKTLIWQGFKQSALTCVEEAEEAEGADVATTTTTILATDAAASRCEEHTFRAQLADNDRWMRITVTLHPRTGSVAGVHMLTEAPPPDRRPTWNGQPGYETPAPLPGNFPGVASDWAVAWTTNDQSVLRQLGGYEPEIGEIPPQYRWFGMPGWLLVKPVETTERETPDGQGSGATPGGDIEILAVLRGPSPADSPAGSSLYLVTVQFTIALECLTRSVVSDTREEEGDPGGGYQIPRCAECPELDSAGLTAASGGGSTGRVGEQRYEPVDNETGGTVKSSCEGVLGMTVDLHVESTESSETATEFNPDLFVLDYGPVGTLDPGRIFRPDTPPDDRRETDLEGSA